MTLVDLAAQRAASAAVIESGAGENTFIALHHEMSRLLDNAGSDNGFGVRFGTPDFLSFASTWSHAEVRARRAVISGSCQTEGDF